MKEPKPLPPLDKLNELLDYNPDTGRMTRKPIPIDEFKATWKYSKKQNWSRWNKRNVEAEAGYVKPDGYMYIKLGGEGYLAHRLAFYMATGVEARKINHLNGERDDNRLANLACATEESVSKNRGKYINNTSGVTGVRYAPRDSKSKPWVARGSVNGKKVHLGRYPTLFEAAASRISWQNQNGYSQRHGR